MGKKIRTVRRGNAEAGISLLKRRRWYSDDPGSDDPTGKMGSDDLKGNSGADTPNSDDDKIAPDGDLTELELARRQIARLNAESKSQREAKQAAQAELDRLRTEQLKTQDDYKTLYEEEVAKVTTLETKAGQAERLEAAVKAANEQRIQLIPDSLREEFRHLENVLSAEELSTALDKFMPKLTAAPIPKFDGGAGGSGSSPPDPDVTEDDKKAARIAKQHGYGNLVDQKSIAARRKNPSQISVEEE